MYTPMRGVNNEGCCAYVRIGGMWEVSVFSPQFCYKPNTVLKMQSLKKKVLWLSLCALFLHLLLGKRVTMPYGHSRSPMGWLHGWKPKPLSNSQQQLARYMSATSWQRILQPQWSLQRTTDPANSLTTLS